ncbi:MAG: tripartite tricarboxylate transporter substrate binding protein [Burkholderiales bacterium]|nr:tripartite tricarboxylate transporter substrate binding protein [Burkholderiales bacterium]
MKISTFASSAAIAALSLAAAQGAHAQGAFPSKSMVMIVPYTPAGSADAMSRAIATRLGTALGRNIVVDNRPGASGMIGTEMVTKAEPDGHTLLGHTSSSYPATAAVRAKLPFDPAKAIIPIGMTARAPMLFAIHPSIPAKSAKELIALVKKDSKKYFLNYGSSGSGGNNHFAGSLFAAAAGIQMQHVPYKGISNAVTALASGEVEVVIASSSALLPQRDSGRIRILGVTSAEKSPLFPDLPTIASQGAPGYEYELWWGTFAPAGMAPDRLKFLYSEIQKIVVSPDMKKFLDTQGAGVWQLPMAQLPDLLPKEIARYKKAAQLAGIQPQ